MRQQPVEAANDFTKLSGNDRLARVREGMQVYDVNGDHVGHVEFVYLGTASPAAIETGKGPATADDINLRADSFVEVIARAFNDVEIPEVLQRRLLFDGFIKIDADGLFAADRYVMPDQVASAAGDRVNLTVSRKSLIKS